MICKESNSHQKKQKHRISMKQFHWTAPPMTEERFLKLKKWAEETKQPEILSFVTSMEEKLRKESMEMKS